MASTPLRRTLLAATLLVIGGCGDAFQPPDQCTDDCALPVTQPPVVTWLFPAPGATVGMSSDLVVKVTDDIRVDHVEFFYAGSKLHPGVIAAAPWHAELGKYRTDWPAGGGAITIYAVGTDIEGKSDTAYITVSLVVPP